MSEQAKQKAYVNDRRCQSKEGTKSMFGKKRFILHEGSKAQQ